MSCKCLLSLLLIYFENSQSLIFSNGSVSQLACNKIPENRITGSPEPGQASSSTPRPPVSLEDFVSTLRHCPTAQPGSCCLLGALLPRVGGSRTGLSRQAALEEPVQGVCVYVRSRRGSGEGGTHSPRRKRLQCGGKGS